METKDAIFFKNTLSLILDDLDTMCDMGFEETLIKIARKLDPLRHTICLSNANTRPVQKVAKATMRNPLLIGCASAQQQVKSVEDKTFKSNNQRNQELFKQELNKFESINAGYIKHGYLTIPTIDRFNLLYTYVRKSLLKKTIIFVQTVAEVKHLVALFRAFDIVTLALHENLKEVERTKVFFEFHNAKQGGVMFVTELSLRGLKFTTPIHNLIHFDSPITPIKYLQRLSHFPPLPTSSTTQPTHLNSILFILRENETGLLESIISKINCTEFELPKQITNVYRDVIKLTDSNFFLNRSSLDAYFAFMRCYIQYSHDGTYNYKGLDTLGICRSLGIENPPAIKE